MPTATTTPVSNELNLGIEVEYPTSQTHETTYELAAEGSHEIEDGVRFGFAPAGTVGYDLTAGVEVTSNVLNVDDDNPAGWYRDAIYELNQYAPFEPCGVTTDSDRSASTIGLHIHLSELSEDEAETLYEFSTQPWMQLFACSSITPDTEQVFRSSYCRLSGFNNGRSSAVRYDSRGQNHYEWRLPEPMTPEHFELVVEFLEKFKFESPEAARDFAQELVQDGDKRLTSFKRAAEVGVEGLADETGMETPDVRRPLPNSRGQFYNAVKVDNSMPYIYVVDFEYGNTYYGFHSRHDRTFEVRGVEFDRDTVLKADNLTPTYGRLKARANDAIEEYRSSSTPSMSDTERRLKQIIKD